jgi:hypothetical protein
MSSSYSAPSRNWTRESRRSAPARLANAYLSATTAANPAGVRERHATTKQVSKRNFDLSDLPRDARGQQRRRGGGLAPTRMPASESAEEEEDEDLYSPSIRRRPTFKSLSHVSTGDLLLEEDDDSDSSYNSFNMNLQKKALFGQDEPSSGLTLLTTEQLNKSQSSASGIWDDRDKLVSVYRVYRSSYSGDHFEEGNLTANLTTGTNRKMFQHELSKPLFRWVHVENPQMKFSFFKSIVLDCPWLDDHEKATASQILTVARQKSDRSLRMPQNLKDSYIEPEYYEEVIRHTVYHGFRSRRQHTDTLRWMCVPYCVIGEKSGKRNRALANLEIDLPPPPILMNTGYVQEGEYYQIAQLWVLMLGDGKVFTFQEPLALCLLLQACS